MKKSLRLIALLLALVVAISDVLNAQLKPQKREMHTI